MKEIRISPDLLKELKKEAKKDSKSLTDYIEVLLLSHPYRILKQMQVMNKSLPDRKSKLPDDSK